MDTFVAINPHAGGGSVGRAWPDLERLLGQRIGAFDHILARDHGDITRHVGAAVAAGARRVIAVGGDGTVNEAVNGLGRPDGGIAEGVAFGVVPIGTGGDFARHFGISADPEVAVAAILAGKTRAIDIGRVRLVDGDGRPGARLFANIASFGISGLVDREVAALSARQWLNGTAAYFLATVLAIFGHRTQRIRLKLDDDPVVEIDTALVVAANCRYFGGGMMIAPDADPADGALDVIVLRGASKWTLLKDFSLVYRGRHRAHPQITITRARRLQVEPAPDNRGGAVLLDIDGEAIGQLPATFEVLPGALRVLV
ncbi:MAG TPA: diacylglycerol kinase family lipid kinase [Hyphomicrobiales bacterium]|nr:diacylglycerol kinase family lipid kinase [Hyphomicrobiales bacterium]